MINPNWNPFEYLNFTGLYVANMPELLNQTNFLRLSRNDLRQLAASGISKVRSFFKYFSYLLYYLDTDPLLDNALAYFDLGVRLIPAESSGIYHYVSTRNNDFSNRDQKGRIIVQPFSFIYQLIGQNTRSIKLE